MSESVRHYVLFELDGQSFAIAADHVSEVALLGRVHRPPNVPPYGRGMMLLRGQRVSLVDLRLLLGMQGHQEVHREALAAFRQRKQDHMDWLNELKASVRERRASSLTLDPHACAFGRWYDHFKTDDPVLSLKLRQFDRPHQRIHTLGAQVRSMTECGQHQEALALIQDRRGKDLAVLLKLFDETLPLLEAADREIVILVSDGTRKIGLVVDHASEMRDIEPQPLDELASDHPLHLAGDLLEGIGVQGERVTVVIEGERLFGRIDS